MISFINILAWVFLVLCLFKIFATAVATADWNSERNKLNRLIWELKTGKRRIFYVSPFWWITPIICLCWIISRFFQP